MSWPVAPLQTAIIRGKWFSPITGSPLTGTARLTPLVPARSPDGQLLFTQQPSAQNLVNGAVEWTAVLLTDSAGLADRVPYRLQVSGSDWAYDEAIELLVSAVSGGVIRLENVAPAVLGPEVATYLLAANRGVANGIAPLGSDGLVPAQYLPVSGGGVPSGRQILTTNGLQGGGDLSADRTLSPLYGSGPNTVCQGNDGRLSDARVPLAHVHAQADVTGLLAALSALDSRLLLLEARIPAVDLVMESVIAASGDPAQFRSGSPLGAAGWVVRLKVPAGKPINGVGMNISSAGTPGAGGTNGYGVMDDNGVLVASTADDNNLFSVVGKRPKSFAAPVASQAADRYVYAGPRVSNYSVGPSFDFIDGTGNGGRLDGLNQTHKRSIILGGSVWGNIDPVSGSSGGGYMPLVWLF